MCIFGFETDRISVTVYFHVKSDREGCESLYLKNCDEKKHYKFRHLQDASKKLSISI